MYSILDESNNEKITSKVQNGFIEFQAFYNTLFKKKILRHNERKTNKRSLSCFDDKRYILKNWINTLAYGHKDI